MLLKQTKKLLCISVLFMLLLPATPLKAGSTLDRLNSMLASSERAARATSLSLALLCGYGTYLAGKETVRACKTLTWQNALRVSLGLLITAGCGLITWACLKNSIPPVKTS